MSLADIVRYEFAESVEIHLRDSDDQLVGDYSLTESLRQCVRDIGPGGNKNAFIANAHSLS